MSLPKSWMSFLAVPSTMVPSLLPASPSRAAPRSSLARLKMSAANMSSREEVLLLLEALADDLHAGLQLCDR